MPIPASRFFLAVSISARLGQPVPLLLFGFDNNSAAGCGVVGAEFDQAISHLAIANQAGGGSGGRGDVASSL
jgi:hypothetical protein